MSDDKPTREALAAARDHNPNVCDGCRDERHGDQAPSAEDLRIAALEDALRGLLDRIVSEPTMSGHLVGIRFRADGHGHATSDAIRKAREVAR